MPTPWSADGELLARWRAGDREAGSALFDRHVDAITGFFLARLREPSEDLVQQTFLALVEGRDRIRRGTSVRAYLLSAAHNVLCAHLRRRVRDGQTDHRVARVADLTPSPPAVLGHQQEQRRLLSALHGLAVEHQVALALRYWRGLDAAQVAQLVGISHSAMRSRMARAHQRLGETITGAAEPPRVELETLDRWAAGIHARLEARPSAG